MQSQLCKTIDIFGGKSYMFVVVLACFASCTSFNIISLHQECCLICCYEIIDGIGLLRFGHDTDNRITSSIHIVLRSRHNPRAGNGTMLIDDSPQNLQMAHDISWDDVIYHYEWKCQSAWQSHQVFDVCDKIVFSYNLILGYGIGMQSHLCRPIAIFGSMYVCSGACMSR